MKPNVLYDKSLDIDIYILYAFTEQPKSKLLGRNVVYIPIITWVTWRHMTLVFTNLNGHHWRQSFTLWRHWRELFTLRRHLPLLRCL